MIVTNDGAGNFEPGQNFDADTHVTQYINSHKSK